jgi:iron complex transport system permease protein
MAFLGGVFISVESMPDVLRLFSRFLPLTYSIEALKEAMAYPMPTGTYLLDLLILAAFSAVPPWSSGARPSLTVRPDTRPYNIARVGARAAVVTLLLAGFATSSMLAAVMSFLMLVSGATLRRIILWTMGGLAVTGWSQVAIVAPLVLGAMLVAGLFARDLNAFLLGEEEAAYLGVNVERRKLTLLLLGSLLTGAAVSLSGLVGFVGLVIPHVARLVLGPDHRLLLPASALVGAAFLVLADLLARSLLAPTEIPVGIVTALIGAPFFIYLLRRSKREYRF